MSTLDPDALPAGHVVGGYRIERELGKGAFGTVYAGVRAADGARAALKVMSSRVLGQLGGPERFQREAELARRIDHPNVVRVLDAGIEGPLLYTAFELLEGQTLEDLVATGPTPPREVCDLALDVLAGLEEAHRLGVVHRDIKPANLFREFRQGQPGRVKLLDFGVAKSTNPNTVAGLTRDGVALGTPAYMAPEQLAGLPVSPAADLFALGLVLAELCMGASVYGEGASALDIVRERLSGARPPIPAWVTSSPLGAVIVAATTPDPAERVPSARALREAIVRVRDSLPVPAAATRRTRPPRITLLGAAPSQSAAHSTGPAVTSPAGQAPLAPWAGPGVQPASPPLKSGTPVLGGNRSRAARATVVVVGVALVAVLGLGGAALVLLSGASDPGAKDEASEEPKSTTKKREATLSGAPPAASSPAVATGVPASSPTAAPVSASFAPLPLAVGQWVRMRTVAASGTTLVEYRIVGKRGEDWVLEEDAEANGRKSTIELVLSFGDRARIDGVSLKSARVKAGGQVTNLPAAAAGPVLAELQRSLRIPPIDGAAREDVTVEAGTFKGCFVREVDETLLGHKVKQRTHAHDSVPINALVKSEGTVDGKPSVTELIAYGTSGAKPTF